MVADRIGASRGLAARGARSTRTASGRHRPTIVGRARRRRRSPRSIRHERSLAERSVSACPCARRSRLPSWIEPSWPRDRAGRAGRQQRRRRRRRRSATRDRSRASRSSRRRRRCLSRSRPHAYRDLVRRALAEDVGAGDVTTRRDRRRPRAATRRVARQARRASSPASTSRARSFAQLDPPSIVFDATARRRSLRGRRRSLARVDGRRARAAHGRADGAQFPAAPVRHRDADAALRRRRRAAAITILDTRKTTPTLRALAKYAVRCGGGAEPSRRASTTAC